MTTPKEIFDKMPSAFKPEAAKGVNSVFQYEISGDGGGTWHVAVKDGTCEVKQEPHANPSVTLKMDSATFVGLQEKTVNPMTAFMTGKIKATGNIMLAQSFGKLFGV